ncbi:hypothetical protein R1sor_027358 [Riccia sorocarpa]|uniref:DNA repair protein RAD51 homolog 3 n=1 Tax=Riccia sorocarpa TaxID=122646 RepID=A0ABD3GH95_9MARC
MLLPLVHLYGPGVWRQEEEVLMDVVALPLPPSLRSKLQAAGYSTIDGSISPVQLARDVSITHEEALGIIKLVPSFNSTRIGFVSSGSADFGGQSAWDLLRNEKARRRIVTSCQELDSILGGGVCTKEMTEICGVPGVGKTQLGIQLAINVQIPISLGGLGGHAVYIDTEGSFMVERAVQMTESRVNELMKKASVDSQLKVNLENLKREVNVDHFLSHIYYFRIHDATEEVAVINSMEKFMVDHSEVRLIVIDSVTFHFRQGFDDMALRTRLLSTLSQKLMALAQKHDLAVVVVNQVTNKVTSEGLEVVPALGESWSHACTNRLILYWNDGQRLAYLFKSPSLPNATAAYDVSSRGITDAAYSYKKAKYT